RTRRRTSSLYQVPFACQMRDCPTIRRAVRMYTKLPNFIPDTVLSALTRGEILVLIYILRRTLGFHKRRDAIPLRQFVHGIVAKDGRRLDCGTGLSRRQVINCIASLEAKGI